MNMENFNDIKNRLNSIIEQSNSYTPACKNCISGCDCGNSCCFGLSESKKRVTTPNFHCSNFSPRFSFNENTLDIIKSVIENMDYVNEGLRNIDLLVDGKISENEFNDIMK